MVTIQNHSHLHLIFAYYMQFIQVTLMLILYIAYCNNFLCACKQKQMLQAYKPSAEDIHSLFLFIGFHLQSLLSFVSLAGVPVVFKSGVQSIYAVHVQSFRLTRKCCAIVRSPEKSRHTRASSRAKTTAAGEQQRFQS